MRFLSFFIFLFLIIERATASDIVGNFKSTVIQPGKVITTGPIEILVNIIAYAIGIAAILGVIGITWGGITMMLSAGEDEKLKKGKYMMIYSLIGVILAGLAYSVVNLVGGLRI